MKIKYTGSYGKVFISLEDEKYKKHFVRNEWEDVGNNIANILLRSPEFISEKNIKYIANGGKSLKILLKRGYALGDLIQLIPVIRQLKKQYNHRFVLWTSPHYVDIMKLFRVFERVISSKPKENFNHFYILDGVLESDHSLVNKERVMHRVHIYEKFFKIKCEEYDFSIGGV